VLAIALWRRLRQLDGDLSVDPRLEQLLMGIPIFTPVPQAALEHLVSLLRPVALDAETQVFTQGDPGDKFFVIETGEVDVLVDGESVRTLGPGGYFGEIALLRDIPRTATIRARTPVNLWALDRDSFLATVTGNAASWEAATAVVGARIGLVHA
jgi:CRP-like cAMP-binding protein